MPISSKKRSDSQLKEIFREIFVSASRELNPFGMVFVYPPENFEQKRLGTIFGVVKISDTSRESSFVANLLASVIKKDFFSKPDRSAYDSFESSLRKANLALAELARQGSVKWMGKISFAGGVLERNNLHFTKLGSASVLLLRDGMIADIGAEMEKEPTEEDSHPLKTFSNISSGKVEKNDCLIFTTSDLLEIFSLEEIRQNSTRFSCDEFPNILSASLNANSELSGAIVLNLISGEEILPEPKKSARKKSFFATQKQPTPATVSNSSKESAAKPPVIPQVDISPARFPVSQKSENEKSIYISESDEIIPKKSILEKISLIAGNAIGQANAGTIAIWKKISYLIRRINWRKIFFAVKPAFAYIRRLIDKINWEKKYVRTVVAAGAVAIIAIVSFSLYKTIGSKNTPSKSASVLSENQNPAPVAALNDINVKNIENISEVAPLPANSRRLMLMSDSLYALSEDKSVLKINPSTGETEKTDSGIATGKFTLAAAMPDLDTIFILTADKKVISFTPSNKKFQENSISLPDNLDAADMKTYLTYLYFLDPSANQIYRYPRAEGGFGEPQNWLKNGQDIKGVNKFAINDAIYTANNLNIIPFLKRKIDNAIDFQKPQVPLRIDAIYTEPGFDGVYVLNSTNRRIVRYSKDGKITAQYFNDSISRVKNFTVDEQNKIIYLQNADSISKFSME